MELKMTTFADVTRQVHLLNDLIITDIICANKDQNTEETINFSKHLLATKYWFARVSWANKKRFLLALLKDVSSVWTLSLLLKSMWNCRPKDAVLSICESITWSSYDQVPMDHDRTALPLSTLTEVMVNEREWFLSLESEQQAVVLTELLSISGGPIMWEVMKRAQNIYEDHVERQLENLQECVVVNDLGSPEKKPTTAEPAKKDQSARHKSSYTQGVETVKQPLVPGQAQKELDSHLAVWASTVKSMKDSMKLEELEMSYKDGTKMKIWKVNRPKPENLESVDIIQLLPSSISKRILMQVPLAQLSDCARVNKYWAYLVDEIRIEIVARQKIDVELEKLRENMLRHNTSLELLDKSECPTLTQLDVCSFTNTKTKERYSGAGATSNKSVAYSLRTAMNKAKKPKATAKPIRNMADLRERLEVRGAADEHIWGWCANVAKIVKKYDVREDTKERNALLSDENIMSFPCPLIAKNIVIPLNPPLVTDPAQKLVQGIIK